jgi:hypothetical protein
MSKLIAAPYSVPVGFGSASVWAIWLGSSFLISLRRCWFLFAGFGFCSQKLQATQKLVLANPNVRAYEFGLPAAAGIGLSDLKFSPCQAKQC